MFERIKQLFSSKKSEIVDSETVGETVVKYIETADYIRKITYDIKGKIINSIITKK